MKLFSKQELENLIVIDIETVSGTKSVTDMSERMQELWAKRCEYLRRKHSDNEGLSDDEIYRLKAGLQAEFGKIICITVGYLRYNSLNQPVIKTKSYHGDDEKILLDHFLGFINQVKSKLPDSKLTGHSAKRFDFPFICKRGLINGLDIPDMLVVHNKKPWEIPYLDTAEIWASGAWQEGFTSLDVLTAVLDIPSPKSDIDGSEVGRVYWDEEDLQRIVMYCERDVVATLQVMMRFAGVDLPVTENIMSV
jgi:predicted PolB exonuclease-like 3'-5' exonuclease